LGLSDGVPSAVICWLQVLEISTREGNLAVGQLEETKKRLCNTQNQLDAMSDSHARTLSRLETAKVSLTLLCHTVTQAKFAANSFRPAGLCTS
jgi:hypothetical protein